MHKDGTHSLIEIPKLFNQVYITTLVWYEHSTMNCYIVIHTLLYILKYICCIIYMFRSTKLVNQVHYQYYDWTDNIATVIFVIGLIDLMVRFIVIDVWAVGDHVGLLNLIILIKCILFLTLHRHTIFNIGILFFALQMYGVCIKYFIFIIINNNELLLSLVDGFNQHLLFWYNWLYTPFLIQQTRTDNL